MADSQVKTDNGKPINGGRVSIVRFSVACLPEPRRRQVRFRFYIGFPYRTTVS